jgi:hypothetical protein
MPTVPDAISLAVPRWLNSRFLTSAAEAGADVLRMRKCLGTSAWRRCRAMSGG